MILLTNNIHESVSDPSVHPAINHGVETGVRDGQDVHDGEDVRKGGTIDHLRNGQSQNLTREKTRLK